MKKLNLLVAAFATFVLVLTLTNVHAKTVYQEYLKRDIPVNYYSDVDTSDNPSNIKAELTDILARGFSHKTYKQVYSYMDETDPVLGDTHENWVIGFYSGEIIKSQGASGSTTYNREHVWAKSHGFKEENTSNPYCDMQHLRPTYCDINGTRSNYFFGEVPNGRDARCGNKVGDNLFEPRDEVKGDVARILMYMEVRYCNTYDLKLVSRDHYTDYKLPEMGNLQTLIKWNYEDPVSPAEIHRNEVCYKYQRNRNPFIDHPEYVGLVYPNDYQPEELDQQAIDNVKNLISALPQTISLSDKDAIDTARSAYDALSISEQNAVSNYSVLTSAESTLSALEEANKPVQDIFMSLSINSSLVLNYNKSTTNGGANVEKDFTTITSEADLKDTIKDSMTESSTNSYYNEGMKCIRLGSSKSTGSINFSLNSPSTSMKIELQPWHSSGNPTGSVSKSDVDITYTNSSGVKSTKSLSMTEDKVYDVSLSDATGITSLKIETTPGGKRAFVKSITLDAATINYTVNSVKLRYQLANIPKKIYDSLGSSVDEIGLVYSTKNMNFAKFTGTLTDFVNSNADVALQPFTKNMIAEENGTYKYSVLFSYVDKDSKKEQKSQYKTKIYAAAYIVVDGKIYFTNELGYSASSLSKHYVDDYSTNADVKKAKGALEALEKFN